MQLHQTIKHSGTAIVVILAGILCNSTLSSANDTMLNQVQIKQVPANVSPQDNQLEGIQNQQWQWQIESENPTFQETTKDEYPLDVNSDQTTPLVDPQTEELDWQNEHKGDPRETGGTIPFLEF